MKIKILPSNLWIKASLLVLAIVLNFSSGQISFTGTNLNAQQQVLLDSHSAANGLDTWTITTHHANELIIISAGGYGLGISVLPSTPGTVTVNGNNATYINEGSWRNPDAWCEAVWAYAAPIAGTYTCLCTETNMSPLFYLNFASSVYQPNCPTGLTLNDVVAGGVDSNHGPTSITATITTTENGSWIYCTVDNNDNGGSGTVAWNNQLTGLDRTYSLGDGVDGAQADSTYALAGTYTITSTDIGASNVWMTIALIAVQPNATCCNLTATTGIKSNISCNGESNGSAFGTPARGHTPYTYSWSPGSQTTDTATGLSAGTYTVTISDTVGCSATASVTISQPLPVSTSITTSDIMCNTRTESGIANVTGGTSPYTYSWSTVPTQTTDTATGLSAGTYTVKVTDSRGCTNTTNITLSAIQVPKPIITGKDTICIGGSTILDVTGGNTYLWNPGSKTGSADTVTVPITTTYTVKATIASCSHDTTLKVTVVPMPRPVIKASKDSVCLGDTLTLSASGGTTYRWSPGNSTNVTIHPNLLNQTTYILYAYGGTCEDSTTQTIKVIQPVSASVSRSRDSICPGDSATIMVTASGGTLSYKWNDGETTASIHVNGTVTTTYTVTVTGTCGSLQDTITLHVIPLPKLTFNGNRFECHGGQDTITVSSSTNPTTYAWSTGKTGTSITPIINGDVIYTVVAKNSAGCLVTDTFSVKEAGNPGVSLTYPKACGVGNFVTITADTSGGTGPYKYSWSSGGTKDTTVVYVEKSGTIFTLTVSNQYGCTATAAATVVIDTPQLYACCSATILLGGDTGIIASGLDITKLQWTPANSGLSCYTCPNPTATPTVTTTYTVSGTDSSDCPVERTVTITVETPCYNFIVPNVFTPTNAGALGLDNILYIPTHGFTSWSLLIFDRWGHEVFKSTDPNKYWDGNNESGASAPEGVYYYVIDAKCTGNSFEKNGFIQLIR